MLCSKKCVDRFRARRESDRNWVGWLQIAFDPSPENRDAPAGRRQAYCRLHVVCELGWPLYATRRTGKFEVGKRPQLITPPTQ
jgi:hypothetical protein